MNRITITIDTGNEPFRVCPESEIARILRNLANQYEEDGLPPRRLYDYNGDLCGTVTEDW